LIEIELLRIGVMGDSRENAINHFSKNEGLFENRNGFRRTSKSFSNKGVCFHRGQDVNVSTPQNKVSIVHKIFMPGNSSVSHQSVGKVEA
jgi:hypothetical protein